MSYSRREKNWFWSSERRRFTRSEEHTSELQSRLHLVCRLLLEKKKKTQTTTAEEHRHQRQTRPPIEYSLHMSTITIKQPAMSCPATVRTCATPSCARNRCTAPRHVQAITYTTIYIVSLQSCPGTVHTDTQLPHFTIFYTRLSIYS